MQKKDFWKGFGAALVLMAVVYFGGQFLAQMNIALPFGMSTMAKIRQIEKTLDTYYVEDYDKELAEELMYTGLAAGVWAILTHITFPQTVWRNRWKRTADILLALV